MSDGVASPRRNRRARVDAAPRRYEDQGTATYEERSKAGTSTMSKLNERIDMLETKLQQLKVRRERIEARKRTLLSKRERAADTRRKILVGAIVLAKVEQGDFDQRTLRRWLDKALTREDDRNLFGLN